MEMKPIDEIESGPPADAATVDPEESSGAEVGAFRVTKYGIGVVLILLVAVIWVAASEWIQYIFGTLDYNKPYFLTYFNTTCFALWNSVFLCNKKWRAVPFREDAITENERSQLTTNGSDISTPEGDGSPESPRMYSWTQVARCALLFCPLWFLANVLFNYSLSMTSVASNTILSTTSSIWTLFLSRLLLSSNIHLLKIAAVALSIGGTAMVALADTGDGSKQKDSIAGDILALISAFFYGSYTTVLKWCLPEEERYFMAMVFGVVGMWNLVMFWPGLIILNTLRVETFELPSWSVLWPLALNTLIGTNLSDVLWAKSVVLTSPFVATLGLSLTTPLAMIADAVLRHKHFSAQYVCGALLVTIGFVVANLKS